ncbi:hypothetical protein ACEWY4_013798 [Coilia grayii]|uniref:Myb/SANT-like DNA-binding domain-containing protein n=1 Tax=Coilia grayii TaxID=363190 RepID=A0ABD1JXE3_9TELE
MARKPNFTSQELNVLVDEVEKRRLVLFSKLKNSVTNVEKKEAWQEVADRVNSVGLGYRRDGANVRNKWRDYSSMVKCKAAALRREQQKTGAGRSTVPDLTPWRSASLASLAKKRWRECREALMSAPCAGCPKHHLGPGSVRHRRRLPFPTLSGEPPALSCEPPALSGEPPALSVDPPSLSGEPLSLSSIPPQSPPLPSPPSQPSSVSPTQRGHGTFRVPSPVPPDSPQSRGSLTETAASPPYARRTQWRRRRDLQCDCSEALLRSEREKVAVLRGIQEELAALREQNQRHHEEVMDYRREKLALLSQKANRAGPNPEVLRAMAALQRIIELNRRRRRRSDVVYVHAYIRQNFNPLEVLADESVVRKYRLTRAQIRELLQLVHPHLVRPTRRNFALTPAVQLLAALRFYASGSFLEVLGDGLGMSKASISRLVMAVTQVLLQLADRMAFPSTPDDIARTTQDFHGVAGLPRVIGVIDGTLIPDWRIGLEEVAGLLQPSEEEGGCSKAGHHSHRWETLLNSCPDSGGGEGWPQPASPQCASPEHTMPQHASPETASPQPTPCSCSPTPAPATLATLSEQCRCSRDWVQLERKKLEVLKELRDVVKEASAQHTLF